MNIKECLRRNGKDNLSFKERDDRLTELQKGGLGLTRKDSLRMTRREALGLNRKDDHRLTD
jgi:hypothetical protein